MLRKLVKLCSQNYGNCLRDTEALHLRSLVTAILLIDKSASDVINEGLLTASCRCVYFQLLKQPSNDTQTSFFRS